jgi:hypothetical protein
MESKRKKREEMNSQFLPIEAIGERDLTLKVVDDNNDQAVWERRRK